MRVRILLIAASAAAALLAAVNPMRAAVAYQIATDPQEPVVGTAAVIEVATFSYGSGGNGASPEPFPMSEPH